MAPIPFFGEVDQFLSARHRTARRARDLLEAIGGAEVGGAIKLPSFSGDTPWKDILTNSVQDLVHEREKRSDRPLFLWDEVPFMLANIKDRDGEPVAMEVLDTLRGLRQTHGGSGLRMIITGSIGLHHVINSLKQQNYANSPFNDTFPFEVPTLDLNPARELAARLMEGESIQTKSPEETAATIAQVSDRFPFYIHHIVKALKQSGLR